MKTASRFGLLLFTLLWLMKPLSGFCSYGFRYSGYKYSELKQKDPKKLVSIDENLLFESIDREKYKKLITLFDERWKRFYQDKSHRFDKGFFLSPLEEVPFKSIDKSSYVNLTEDAAYVVEEFRGYILAVSSDRKKIYVSEDRDFSNHYTVRIGEEIPVIKHYYLEGITANGLKLLWGHLKPNYKICRSFLEMYRITKDEKYLEPARKILVYLIEHVGEDGRYRLPFPWSPRLVYRAMHQSWFIQSLYDYLKLSPKKDPYLESAMERIGRAFYFTDEGTRNHWLEANIAVFILDRLGIQKIDFEKYFKKFMSDLELFYEYIIQYDGKIPYITKLSHPPRFCSLNYQNFNTMLLAVLSAKYLRRDIGLKKIFPLIFKVAKKEDSNRLLRGLYYAKLQFDFDDPEWVREKERLIMKTDSFIEIPTLLKYKILTSSREEKPHD
jgi:hypothetical protein